MFKKQEFNIEEFVTRIKKGKEDVLDLLSDLEGRPILDHQYKEISEALSGDDENKTLKFESKKLNQKRKEEISTEKARIIKDIILSSDAQEIIFSKICLGTRTFQSLVDDGILRLDSLESLSFINCSLDGKKTEYLFKGIKNFPNLKKLDLSGNKIKGSGKALKEILEKNTTLEVLILNDTCIDSGFLKHLHEVLNVESLSKTNDTLQELSLEDNKIDKSKKEYKDIEEKIKQNKSLKEVKPLINEESSIIKGQFEDDFAKAIFNNDPIEKKQENFNLVNYKMTLFFKLLSKSENYGEKEKEIHSELNKLYNKQKEVLDGIVKIGSEAQNTSFFNDDCDKNAFGQVEIVEGDMPVSDETDESQKKREVLLGKMVDNLSSAADSKRVEEEKKSAPKQSFLRTITSTPSMSTFVNSESGKGRSGALSQVFPGSPKRNRPASPKKGRSVSSKREVPTSPVTENSRKEEKSESSVWSPILKGENPNLQSLQEKQDDLLSLSPPSDLAFPRKFEKQETLEEEGQSARRTRAATLPHLGSSTSNLLNNGKAASNKTLLPPKKLEEKEFDQIIEHIKNLISEGKKPSEIIRTINGGEVGCEEFFKSEKTSKPKNLTFANDIQFEEIAENLMGDNCELDLGSCSMNLGVISLIKNSKKIKTLKLSEGNIMPIEASLLGKAIKVRAENKENKPLERLLLPKSFMSYKFLEGYGVSEYYESLRGDESLKSLLSNLTSIDSLTEIDLSGNKISDEGLKSLLDCLTRIGSVVKLDLSGNEISDKGAELLREFIEKSGTLKELNLANNKIGCNGVALLRNYQNNNQTLKELILKGNSTDISKADFDEVKGQLSSLFLPSSLEGEFMKDTSLEEKATRVISTRSLSAWSNSTGLKQRRGATGGTTKKFGGLLGQSPKKEESLSQSPSENSSEPEEEFEMVGVTQTGQSSPSENSLELEGGFEIVKVHTTKEEKKESKAASDVSKDYAYDTSEFSEGDPQYGDVPEEYGHDKFGENSGLDKAGVSPNEVYFSPFLHPASSSSFEGEQNNNAYNSGSDSEKKEEESPSEKIYNSKGEEGWMSPSSPFNRMETELPKQEESEEELLASPPGIRRGSLVGVRRGEASTSQSLSSLPSSPSLPSFLASRGSTTLEKGNLTTTTKGSGEGTTRRFRIMSTRESVTTTTQPLSSNPDVPVGGRGLRISTSSPYSASNVENFSLSSHSPSSDKGSESHSNLNSNSQDDNSNGKKKEGPAKPAKPPKPSKEKSPSPSLSSSSSPRSSQHSSEEDVSPRFNSFSAASPREERRNSGKKLFMGGVRSPRSESSENPPPSSSLTRTSTSAWRIKGGAGPTK